MAEPTLDTDCSWFVDGIDVANAAVGDAEMDILSVKAGVRCAEPGRNRLETKVKEDEHVQRNIQNSLSSGLDPLLQRKRGHLHGERRC